MELTNEDKIFLESLQNKSWSQCTLNEIIKLKTIQDSVLTNVQLCDIDNETKKLLQL